MSDPDRTIDFRGFATAVAEAAKPDFTDVLTRSVRHRRRRRWFGSAFVALTVALSGGTAVALTASPPPSKPAPAPTTQPWHTTPPRAGAEPKQQSYTEGKIDWYVPLHRDGELTGQSTPMLAGDLDHLYLQYRKCKAAQGCTWMLAVTSDRGRTWRKLPLPPKDLVVGQPKLTLVHGSLVAVAALGDDLGTQPAFWDLPNPVYWISMDAGMTWRRPKIREVDAVPAGWLIQQQATTLEAIDPGTGDVVRVKRTPPHTIDPRRIQPNIPASAGIWVIIDGTFAYAQVSRDGGRTWATRNLPPRPDSGTFVDRPKEHLITADGKTIYLAREYRGELRLHVSVDDGRTWVARPDFGLDGPLLTVLPIDDHTLIIEGGKGTYRSTDQGRTFTRVGPLLGQGGHAIPGGFTIPTNNNEFSAWVSPDGAEWTYVKRPQVP
ncbi:sialidase family protein [Actinoplanes regularis]|uniref:sialidase family protein n=1 Tax=Actinoplanes regularis TaxID=52697 RepID=UPI0024A5CD98|nr:sialidase family protein [Actinoplanes regularis]GLW32803.1 hypothetical protein Areg01_57410 [Actinoplanes regularis]